MGTGAKDSEREGLNGEARCYAPCDELLKLQGEHDVLVERVNHVGELAKNTANNVFIVAMKLGARNATPPPRSNLPSAHDLAPILDEVHQIRVGKVVISQGKKLAIKTVGYILTVLLTATSAYFTADHWHSRSQSVEQTRKGTP